MNFNTGAPEDTGPSDDDAVASLMASMLPTEANADEGKPKASDEAKGDEDDEDDDNGEDEGKPKASDEDDEGDEDGEEDGAGDGTPKEPSAGEIADDAVISIEIDGQTTPYTVAQLKALAGQETVLKSRVQEADLAGQNAASVLQGSLAVILEDLGRYQGVDWVLEGQRMDPAEFEWHRENYTGLLAKQEKLTGAANSLNSQLSERQQAAQRAQAEEAVRVLSDPKSGIKGFGPALYKEIVEFAVEAGLAPDDADQIVNPSVLRIINDARLYRAAQKTTASKVSMTPNRVRKGSGTEAIPTATSKNQRALERKMQAGQGSDDDAIALLMGRWGV